VRLILETQFAAITPSKISGTSLWFFKSEKILESQQSKSLAALRHSRPIDLSFMLHINHAFEQRINLATPFKIE